MYQDPYQSPNQPPYVLPGAPTQYGPSPYYVQGPPPQKRSNVLWIVLGIVGGLVLLSCIGCSILGIVLSQQVTVRGIPHPIPTKQVHQTATAQTIASNSYLASLFGNGRLVFTDPLSQESGSQWGSSRTSSTGGTCLFDAGAYHVNQKTNEYLMDCFASGTFSNFAFEVQLTITQGDCGGIVFRGDDNGNFYLFDICQNGWYTVNKYMNYSAGTALLSKSSSTINTGLGQQNKIAVVAVGNTMTFYVNEQQIAQEQDDSYTSGSLGLTADPGYHNATDVAYTNARLWTR